MSKLTFDNIALLLEVNAETDAIFAFGELAKERNMTTFELSVFVRSFYKFGSRPLSDLVLNIDIVEEYIEKEDRSFYEFVNELDKLTLACVAAEDEVNRQIYQARYKYYNDSDAY